MRKITKENLNKELITQEELIKIEESYKKKIRKLEESNEILRKATDYFAKYEK